MRHLLATPSRPIGILLFLAACLPSEAWCQGTHFPIPSLTLSLSGGTEPGQISMVLEIFLLMTLLSLAPAILMMLTSFTRIAIVLSILRQAIGVPQMPPTQIVLGLALFLTFFVMTPVWKEVHRTALEPYLAKEIGHEEAFRRASVPLRDFMLRQTREKDLALFVNISERERPRTIQDVPLSVVVPSFIISELKTAFEMGFMLFIPFIVIDMVVASALLSLGMMMLPPVMISLPFKLMLFVLVDGWNLIIGSLVTSFVS